jgi:MBOAT, membrane-bound O-acyltransferase family
MGHPAISVLACLATAYALAIAVYPVVRRRGVFCIVTVSLASIAIVVCLFIIPREQVVLRALTALLIVDLFFRLIDFTRQSWRGEIETAGWLDYCRFLIPFPWLSVVFGQKDRRIPLDQRSVADLIRVLLGSAGVGLGFVLLFAANEIPALQSSFVLDHITKLFIFVLTVESLAQGVCGLERLVGFVTRPLTDRGFLSRTPAEFWRRYNTRVQPWLYWNVFVPSGGRRAPVRGVWTTFLVSATLHEVAFAIALSRFTGYQFFFFLIQAPAVLLSPSLDRLSRATGACGAVFAHAITILWMGSTSIFFFDGVDRIFRFFYASERWLP